MTTLNILSWNIWMMPTWSHSSPSNHVRAAAIAQVLQGLDKDLLCLQKAFDPDARAVIGTHLKPLWPHQYGPLNEHGSPLVINGGVWVLSRLPLTDLKEIKFSKSAGVERFSRKGAMFLRGTKEGQPFQLVVTHQQGDDQPRYNPKHQKIRNEQTSEIAAAFASWNNPQLPTFFCGDFSTPRRAEADPFQEIREYQEMLSKLGARNGPEDRITLDARKAFNDLTEEDTGRQAEMDYILVRDGSAAKVSGTWERLILRHSPWDEKREHKDLSYRFAVSGRFTISGG